MVQPSAEVDHSKLQNISLPLTLTQVQTMQRQETTLLCGMTQNKTSVFCQETSTTPSLSTPPVEVIWTPDVIQRIASLVFIMILTFAGNTAILIVLNRSRYRKRYSRVNIFIINLAVGDLTVCFVTMTTEILFVAFGEWVLGAAACKILTYAQVVTLASTTFILTAMSFDRFMAICIPFRFTPSTSRARKMIATSWILAFVFAIPQLLIFVQTVDGTHENGTPKYGCKSRGYTAEWQRKVYFTFMTVYILVIPSILISYCYINVARVVWKQGKVDIKFSSDNCSLRKTVANRGVISKAKMKTIKMTLCIIITFIACWTPYFVTTLIRIYSNYTYQIPSSVMAFAETVALLQSAVNPFLYGIFNIKLGPGLMDVFCPGRVAKKHKRQSLLPENGMTYCFIHNTNKLTIKCRDHFSSSSSGTSTDKLRPHSCIIAEANKDGFRLRVRFTSKELVHVHDRNGRCLYPTLRGVQEEPLHNESTL
ncbi:hypothetical protein ACJMK2_019984 [Sinanodonta woodiana]|uniref:G-protein coupled receptors family 1 profile domain-containing protein n=1 Tax=Sinanodonta woodiana TaxID=1069815 RepID=A0ABD3U0Z1_SINWO